MSIGSVIMSKRKSLGYTQQELADKLHVSFQAVSKWENDTACPEIDLLPKIANVFGISVDALFEYKASIQTEYEERYRSEDYYWGLNPNGLCLEIMRLRPPVKPYRVLDMGCGEGKDAVFLARNGYEVTAFDIADSGIEKGKMLAERCGTYVDFFKADITDYRLKEDYDIIFSSGMFHYVIPEKRQEITENMKAHTTVGGIHVINVFVDKPFIPCAPDSERYEKDKFRWRSGELFTYYHDWLLHKTDEIIFDCNSGGIPHKHCMDVMIAEKMQAE